MNEVMIFLLIGKDRNKKIMAKYKNVKILRKHLANICETPLRFAQHHPKRWRSGSGITL